VSALYQHNAATGAAAEAGTKLHSLPMLGAPLCSRPTAMAIMH
jgi:hypothetical protein